MKNIFISYSHADEKVLDGLHKHMAMLKREKLVSSWTDNEIPAGGTLDSEIDEALREADIFLAVVSPDYLDSNYCYDKEFKAALEMHQQGDIIIVPVIAEYCDWKSSPFGSMKAIPKDGKPISGFTNQNNAFLNIVDELRKLISKPKKKESQHDIDNSRQVTSNKTYKIKKDFTEVDRVNFKEESFIYIKKYFSESIVEINDVENIQARFVAETDNSFTCLIANRAKVNANTYLTVSLASNDVFGRSDLRYEFLEKLPSNSGSFDKNFSIEQNDYELFWSAKSPFNRQQENAALTAAEIAERLWQEFIDKVGISY